MKIIEPKVNYVIKTEPKEIETLDSAVNFLGKLLKEMDNYDCDTVIVDFASYDISEIECVVSLLDDLKNIVGINRR